MTDDKSILATKSLSKRKIMAVSIVVMLLGSAAGFLSGYIDLPKSSETAAQTSTATTHESAKKSEEAPASTHETAPNTEPSSEANAKTNAAASHENANTAEEVSADAKAGAPKAEANSHGNAPEGDTESAVTHGGLVFPLDPIVTNIAQPSDVWIRFEAVIKAKEPLADGVADAIHQDFLAYFHSLRLSELTGTSAFLDLKYELLSRANTRSNDKVGAVYIKTFIFE